MKKSLFIIFLASTTLHTSSEVFAMERKRISDEISDEISKEKPESQKEEAPEQKRKKQEDAQDPESAAGIAVTPEIRGQLAQVNSQQGQLVNSGAAASSSKVAPTNALVIVSTQGWSELHIAAKDGNLEKIKQLLTANPAMLDLKIDALGTKFNGNTALHMSARYGHKAIVEYLVEKFGANRIKNDILMPIMEQGPNQGVTALAIAFGNGSIEILKYFAYLFGIEKFKEAALMPIVTGSNAGKTSLYIAFANGCVDALKYFEEMVGVEKFKELVLTPIATGANAGLNSLHIALANGCVDAFKYFEKMVGVEKFKELVLTPIATGANAGLNSLYIAFANGCVDALKYFEKMVGVEKLKEAVLTPVDTGPYSGKTSFYLAAGDGRVEVLRYFEKLFVNDIDRIRHVVLSPLTNGYNAFQIAVACGCTDVVKYFAYLLGNEKFKEAVLTPVATGPHAGKTPLHTTAESGRLDILKYFVEVFGVDIDIIRQAILRPIAEGDFKGYTAFKMAALNGQKAMIEYFCEKIFDNNIYTLRQAILIPITSGPHAKITAFNVAAINGHIEVVEYFGKLFREEILGAQKKEDIHALGYSAIEMAACGGSIPVLEYFVKQFGVDRIKQQLLSALNVGDTNGGLDSAVARGHVDVLDFVLDKFFHAGQIAEFADTVLRRIAEISRKLNGVSGLYRAASNGHVKIFRYFCDILFMCHNLDYVRTVILQPLSNGTNQGLTVVHLAVCNKRKELIEFFVNVFGKNVLKIPAGHGPNAGRMPLDMATDLHDEEFSKYLDALSK